MSTLREKIDVIRADGLSMDACLMYCIIWLKGGSGRQDELRAEATEWYKNHDDSWDALYAWIEEREIDAEIVRPIVESNSKKE